MQDFGSNPVKKTTISWSVCVFQRILVTFSPISGKSTSQENSANPHLCYRGHEALEPVQGQSSYDVWDFWWVVHLFLLVNLATWQMMAKFSFGHGKNVAVSIFFSPFCSSHSRFCSYDRKIRRQKLPNEGRKGFSAVRVLWKREYSFFRYFLKPAEYLHILSHGHPYQTAESYS